MYNYLSAKNPYDIEAVLHTEGRVVAAGDSNVRRSDVAIRHLCFLIDYMHVRLDDILFLSLYKDKDDWIKAKLVEYLSEDAFNKVIVTLNDNDDVDVAQSKVFQYLIVWGIEKILYPLNFLINNLIGRSKNVFLCGDIADANNKVNWEALEFFVNPKNDVTLFLTDYSSMVYHRAIHSVRNRQLIEQKRIEREKQEREEKNHAIASLVTSLIDYRIRVEEEFLKLQEQEMRQKREIFPCIISSLEKYVTTFNRLGGQQFWVARLPELECRKALSSNKLPFMIAYMPTNRLLNGHDAMRMFYEFKGRTDHETFQQFKSWWSTFSLVQDNDILLLQDTTADIIRGIGRIFIGSNKEKNVIWINQDCHRLNIVFDKSQLNPIRIEDKSSVTVIQKTIERIIRGF